MGSIILFFFFYLEEKNVLKDKQQFLHNMKSFLNLSGGNWLHDSLTDLWLLP